MSPFRCAIASEPFRYLSAAILGLLLDVAVALILRTQLGAANLLAAGAGFYCGAGLNYVTFELWVFGGKRLSWRGLSRLMAAAQTALLLRLAAVWLLTRVGLAAPAVLVLAAGLSFVANYLLSRVAIKRKVQP
jgi:putative flippase GtrA